MILLFNEAIIFQNEDGLYFMLLQNKQFHNTLFLLYTSHKLSVDKNIFNTLKL